MSTIILRKTGNNLNNFKVNVTDLWLDEVKEVLDFADTEKITPMPSDTDEIGGVRVSLAHGVSTTEQVKVNLYNATGVYNTIPIETSPSEISRNYISIEGDTTIFEIVCNTLGVTPPETLTITKGDFKTNSGKYDVKVGANSLDPLIATLEFNDETTTIDKPEDYFDFSTVNISFSEGEIFESGYVEVYDEEKVLLDTFNLEYEPLESTAYYNYKVQQNTSLMLVYITFHELPTHDEISNFNHTYSMLPSELERLIIEGLGVATPQGTIDLRGYMLNLLSFPFAIPPDLIGEREKIVLGDYDRKTESTVLKGDILTYSLGSIEVPLKYKNAYDFYSAETTLILPYTENIVLSPEYVIGATISIEYVVEVYKGTVNINVTSSKTDKPIYNGTTSIGRQIPFISYWKVLGDESIYTSVYNNQTKATIEVKRKTPLQLENGLDTSEYGTIGDFKGYVEIFEVGFVGSTMGGYEQEQLISILNKGVIL